MERNEVCGPLTEEGKRKGKERVEKASMKFNVHVSEIVGAIWFALRDQTLAIQERELWRLCRLALELLDSMRHVGVGNGIIDV